MAEEPTSESPDPSTGSGQAVGHPVGLLIWMLAGGSCTDAGRGGMGCFDMMGPPPKEAALS